MTITEQIKHLETRIFICETLNRTETANLLKKQVEHLKTLL